MSKSIHALNSDVEILAKIYKEQGVNACTIAFNALIMRRKLKRWEAAALSDRVFKAVRS